jgi:hypothetical protein
MIELKQKTIKHPFSKERLKIVDLFEFNKCEKCGGVVNCTITAEDKTGTVYYFLECHKCSEAGWFFPSKYAKKQNLRNQ